MWTGTRLRGAPSALVTMLLAVECAAIVIATAALAVAHPSVEVLLRLGLLTVLSIAFEEISLQVGKLRLLMSTGPQPDMTSVWTFAGALVLPAGYAALLAVIVFCDVWLRRQRSAGQYMYRKVYSAATIVLGCLATTAVRANLQEELNGTSRALAAAVATVMAAVAFTLINRLLIVGAARLANPQAEISILGSASDNALELATLCLAVMTAVVLVHQPALCVLVLLPMVLLQRGALVKQLETAAALDPKTGLLNAIAWQQVAHRELERLDREEAPGCVLLIDLDHFKRVNDEHGHLVGDATLTAVAARLTREMRPYDVVGRFGGEEFVAFLPGLGAADAFVAAERIRTAVASIALCDIVGARTDNESLVQTVTASIGMAIYPEHGDDVESLLRAADIALYRAKDAGRNCIVVGSTDTLNGRDE
jgi:diguanylate cyclase (GGDEF)-like protein